MTIFLIHKWIIILEKGTRERLYFSDLSFKSTSDHKEHRNEEDCQQRCRHHSSHNPGTHRILRATACTITDNQRHTPQ